MDRRLINVNFETDGDGEIISVISDIINDKTWFRGTIVESQDFEKSHRSTHKIDKNGNCSYHMDIMADKKTVLFWYETWKKRLEINNYVIKENR